MLLEIHVSGLNINKKIIVTIVENSLRYLFLEKSTDKCHKPQIPIQFKIRVRFCIQIHSNGPTRSHRRKV